MVEEDEGLADDACEEANWPIDAVSAKFEVLEAPSLERAELRIWLRVSVRTL